MSYGGGGAARAYYQQQPRYQQQQQYAPPPQPQDQQQQATPPLAAYSPHGTYYPPSDPPPQPPPPPNCAVNNPNEKQDFDQAFSIAQPKWNDLWAGILFLIFVAGFAAVSGISLARYDSTKSSHGNGNGLYDGTNSLGLSTNTTIGFIICVGFAVTLSYGYVMLARAFTKQLIWITGILNIAFGLGIAIYMLYNKYYSGGIVFIVFVGILIFAFVSWIPRIPFSVVMLHTAIDVARSYGHVYTVSFVGGIVATAFAVWFSITLVAVYARFQPGNNCGTQGCSQAKVIGMIVFLTFTAYWISEFIKNAAHVTTSGVYGSWYFRASNMPRGATRGAFKRAMTTSFGSISLGSLIVAIVNFLRQLCSMAQSQAASGGNAVGAIFFCCLGCLISILDWAVKFINRYAFSHIALYGKAYIPAAKDTWRMIKDRGIDALVNECLIGPVFSVGAMFVAYACALCAYIFLRLSDKNDTGSNGSTPVVIAFAFLIGLQICNVFTTPLSSGIDTIFVAAAWDPEVMVNQHPELYQRMITTYPHVQQAIHA